MKTGNKAIVRLRGHYNNYSWGKMGHNSEVARLFQAGHKDFAINPDLPYSEQWMGTHPDGPATLEDGTHLSSFIAQQNERNNNTKTFDTEAEHLPFIMKVMSIERTLSLQVHPTKEQAVLLNQLDPQNYPDRNHKPELAYALTRFQLLCGFRPHEEMLQNLESFRSLRALFGAKSSDFIHSLRVWLEEGSEENEDLCKAMLKECFVHMMDVQEPKYLNHLIDTLFNELDNGARGAVAECTVEVMKRMRVDFPGDVGVFSPLILNHMILEPGECCYYAAQELHAYISGECVECVGCSNNTIRAAMTPKFIDRRALIEILNYQMTEPEKYLVHPETIRDYPAVDYYAPDCKDFQLHRIRVNHGAENTSLAPLDCGSIIVIHSGRAIIEEEPSTSTAHIFPTRTEVMRGDIFYIQPGRRLRFASCTEDLEAFQTFSFEEGPELGHKVTVIRTGEKTIQNFEEGRLRKVESGIIVDELELDGCL